MDACDIRSHRRNGGVSATLPPLAQVVTPRKASRKMSLMSQRADRVSQVYITTQRHRVRARRAFIAFVVMWGWWVLYSDLLGKDVPGKSGMSWISNLMLKLVTIVVGYLLCDGLIIVLHGRVVYGRVGVYQRRTWMSVAITASMFLVLLANCIKCHSRLLYAVPVCALARLFLSLVVDDHKQGMSEVSSLLQNNGLDVKRVLAAVDAAPGLSDAERKTLQKVARSVDEEQDMVWGVSDLRRFLRSAETSLTGGKHRLPVETVDMCLFKVVDQMGCSNHRARENYGIFCTISSGFSHLASRPVTIFCAATCLDAIIGPLQARMISLLTQSIVDGNETATLWQIGVYLGSFMMNFGIYAVLIYSYSVILANATAGLQRKVATHMLNMTATENRTNPSGSVNAIFASDIARLQVLWTGMAWSLQLPLMRVLFSVAYASWISPQVGLLALTVFPVIFITVPQSHSASAASAHARANSETISAFQNGIECQRMLWIFDKQSEWLQTCFEPLVKDQERKHMRMQAWGGVVQAYVQQLVNIFVFVHVSILAWLAVTRTISAGEFAGFVSLFYSMGTPSVGLAGFYRVALTCAGSAQRVDEFLGEDNGGVPAKRLCEGTGLSTTSEPTSPCKRELRSEIFASSEVEEGKPVNHDGSVAYQGLELCDVSFRYPGASESTFENVSLRVPTGKFMSLVGDCGCGKSTLLSLLMTWLSPTGGSIRIGDVAVGRLGSHDLEAASRRLRENIAVVFQDTILMQGTVYANIAIGSKGHSNVTRRDVEWAASAAGCADFITTELPGGYETVLGGAHGVSLSGGQAQSICIARALVGKPRVLLLDEATSALDPGTEERVIATISNLRSSCPKEFGDLIIIAVTHRPSALRHSDLVVRIEHKGIQEMRSKFYDLLPTAWQGA